MLILEAFCFKIYIKPTTDLIIPYNLNHPQEHKMSAIRYLTSWLITYPLNNIDKKEEYKTTKHILHNNKYDPLLLDKAISTVNTKTHTQQETLPTQTIHKTKLATFTYVGPQTKFITKLFKNTNLNIAYKTNNTIGKLLTPNNTSTSDKFNKSGIYQLTCLDCNMKYIGQTGRSIYTRYCEHFRDFKHANGNSKYAQHLIENRHSIGPIKKIMDILYVIKKGKMMDTLEKFHIYNLTKLSNQINDKIQLCKTSFSTY